MTVLSAYFASVPHPVLKRCASPICASVERSVFSCDYARTKWLHTLNGSGLILEV